MPRLSTYHELYPLTVATSQVSRYVAGLRRLCCCNGKSHTADSRSRCSHLLQGRWKAFTYRRIAYCLSARVLHAEIALGIGLNTSTGATVCARSRPTCGS
jgi:hypothetical protein